MVSNNRGEVGVVSNNRGEVGVVSNNRGEVSVASNNSRPLNLPGQFIVRATHFHSEIGLSHSEIPVQSSHNARFGVTK